MLRLLSIEYFKLKHTRYFWVLLVLFAITLLAIPIASKVFLDFMAAEGENFFGNRFAPDELPLYDFVDIWQNLTWVYTIFSILLGFITVISVSNEYSYGTIKQNVIDGLSRTELLGSKLLMIGALSAVASALVFLIGLGMGLTWSPVKTLPFITKNLQFIPAYFMHLVTFQIFCLLITLLIKRSGITIALLIFYIFMIEPIITSIIRFHYELPALADLFPITAFSGHIPNPFPKYLLRETLTFVPLIPSLVLLVYLSLSLWLSYRMMVKRDLR